MPIARRRLITAASRVFNPDTVPELPLDKDESATMQQVLLKTRKDWNT
jgi:hypothetical protein